MATLLDLIRKSNDIKVLRFKDRMQNPSGGWRDAMINFCVVTKDCPHPDHICEVQIVHRKMAVCRNKDGLGGHDEYAIERNAREILEYLGTEAEALSSRSDVIAWMVQTKLRLSSAFRVVKWAHRAKSRVVHEPAAITTQTVQAPVASESRPESSASKCAVTPGKEEGETALSVTEYSA